MQRVHLRLFHHLHASGHVTVTDQFDLCRAGVPVKIQYHNADGFWETVRRPTTDEDGHFDVWLPDRRGLYRASAPKVEPMEGHVCDRARSDPVLHIH